MQAKVVGVGQLPSPSQRVAFVCVPAVQLSASPQAVVLSGYTQAPASKVQLVAPHVGSLVEQAPAQQLVGLGWPVMPHFPDLQASFSVQAPVRMGAPHTPALQKKPAAQSLLEAQLELQPPSSLQPKLAGQAVGFPISQVPLPLQLAGVDIAMLQELPQLTLGCG